MHVVLRTTQDPASLAGSARHALHSVDSDLPIAYVETLNNIVDDSLAQPRFAMLLLGAFGIVALILASIGL